MPTQRCFCAGLMLAQMPPSARAVPALPRTGTCSVWGSRLLTCPAVAMPAAQRARLPTHTRQATGRPSIPSNKCPGDFQGPEELHNVLSQILKPCKANSVASFRPNLWTGKLYHRAGGNPYEESRGVWQNTLRRNFFGWGLVLSWFAVQGL